MKYIKKLATVAAVIGLLGLTSWKLYSNRVTMNDQAAIAEMKTVKFPVTVVEPSYQMLSQDFEVQGDFQPSRSLKFQSEASGRVIALKFEKGDYVRAGQLMALLDSEQLQTDLELAQLTFEKAKTDLGKLEAMLSAGAVNSQQVADAKLNVKNTQTRLKTIEHQIEKCSIYAPISGHVQTKSIEKGSFLSPGAPIAEIVDTDELKMSVYLSDYDVVKVQNGQVVSIKPDLLEDQSIQGKIVSIASVADGARKYEVEISFANNSQPRLKAGMTGKAVFETGEPTKFMMIPSKCISGSIKDPEVFVLKGDVAHLQKIKTGALEGNMVAVLSGLEESAQVVETGQLNITDGSIVNILK